MYLADVSVWRVEDITMCCGAAVFRRLQKRLNQEEDHTHVSGQEIVKTRCAVERFDAAKSALQGVVSVVGQNQRRLDAA